MARASHLLILSQELDGVTLTETTHYICDAEDNEAFGLAELVLRVRPALNTTLDMIILIFWLGDSSVDSFSCTCALDPDAETLFIHTPEKGSQRPRIKVEQWLRCFLGRGNFPKGGLDPRGLINDSAGSADKTDKGFGRTIVYHKQKQSTRP